MGLARPVTAAGGDILVCDVSGMLFLCDSNGDVTSRINTGGGPFRWRPAVGRDGRVYLSHAADVVCIDGAERAPARPLVATDLTLVAEDFVVDLWLSGHKVPLALRHAVVNRPGLTTEHVALDVRQGDWLVFSAVANLLRSGSDSYFALRATDLRGEEAFVSRRGPDWSACDEPGEVPAYLAQREVSGERPAILAATPSIEAAGTWRSVLGSEFTGEPLWGKEASTWLKFRAPPLAETPIHLRGDADRSPPAR